MLIRWLLPLAAIVAGLNITLKEPTPTGEAGETWSRILEVIESGEMPPKTRPRPESDAIRHATQVITTALAKQSGPPPIALRRLNRVEYENTVHDLLGIDVSLRLARGRPDSRDQLREFLTPEERVGVPRSG